MKDLGESVKIIVGKIAGEIEEPLTYSLPSHLKNIKLGAFVVLEVGGRLRIGCVVGRGEEKGKEPVITFLPIPPLPPHLLSLAHWLSNEYLSSLQDSFQTIVPEVLNAIPSVYLYPNIDYQQVRGKVRREMVREAEGGVSYTTLKVYPTYNARQKIVALINSQILIPKIEVKFKERGSQKTFPLPPIPKISPIPFNSSSKVTILWGGDRTKRLALYLGAILKIVSTGGNAILVMPDSASAEWAGKALSQFVKNTYIYHRRIPLSQRYYLWQLLAMSFHSTLVVGNRSALFAPLPNVKLIIVEGDGESSLIRKEPPSYDAGNVAYQRMVQEGVRLIYGSDLPSLPRYNLAKKGIPLKKLPFQLGEMEITDAKGTRHIIPPKTREEIDKALKENGKVVLVVNRKGLFYLSCRDCGNSFLCPSCNVPLILCEVGVQKKRFLFCHLCGNLSPAPDVCPNCGSYKISARGMGIQRLASAVKRLFPTARVATHSSETPSQPFWDADIIVATKAIVPWVDLIKPTLSCIFDIDSLLRFPNFSQYERVYRLIFTLRKESKKLIIHTNQPENPLFSYEPIEYLELESEARRERNFPPFGHILTFVISEEEESRALEKANGLHQHLLKNNFHCLPPFPSLYPKRGGVYRYLLVIPTTSLNKARQILKEALEYDRNLKWFLDIQELE
jgi:primosomal protein N' (replication factor Y)